MSNFWMLAILDCLLLHYALHPDVYLYYRYHLGSRNARNVIRSRDRQISLLNNCLVLAIFLLN